jgi:hypothetical protein
VGRSPSPTKGASPTASATPKETAEESGSGSGASAGVAAGVAVSLLLVVALLVAAVILIRKKSPGMCAKTEEHDPTSMVTMYPLIEEFSDFGRDFGQNNE